jgi:glycyl-tRNA synthetase beta chain
MAELLLELLSEEIPARMQARAAEDLQRLVSDALGKARLEFSQARSFATPRRLALVIEGLPAQQPDMSVERKGPKVGAPDKAIEGFLRSVGLDSLDQCEQRETEKGPVWFAVAHEAGRASAEVLAELLPDALGALGWPKSMRWGEGEFRWVRPLRGVLCVFDGAPVRFTFGGVASGAQTRGHPFLAPAPFEVKGFADYEASLRDAKVMLDAAERQRVIREQAEALVQAEGLALAPDEALLAENAGLVEWPVVKLGTIDAAFMDVPPEVLTSAMRKHQKYFAVMGPDGKLAPRFVMVADMETADNEATIVAGNERVLRARLADAKFFWDQDRRRTLAERAPELAGIVFHAKLGTLDAKADRIQALAVEIAGHVTDANRDQVRSAARLCKADLVTEMVGEFPDLQGVMGRYYAHHDGEDDTVADAIAEHYAPQGPGDACPRAPVSVCVALADKIDTLVGFWAIDEKPTGSKDPFALRRAALGVIRLILENGLRLPLRAIFEKAETIHGVGNASPDRVRAADDLLAFFADRLKVHLREKGVRHDLIAAVFEQGGEDDLVRLLAKVDALAEFLASEDGANLLVAYRRAANILAIEEKKDAVRYDGEPEPGRFDQPEEGALFEAIAAAEERAGAAVAEEDFSTAMTALAQLRGPVDGFFDEVTVNSDDAEQRRNRLCLLARIRAALDRLADFSKIEG